jgi:hypothetical protein
MKHVMTVAHVSGESLRRTWGGYRVRPKNMRSLENFQAIP